MKSSNLYSRMLWRTMIMLVVIGLSRGAWAASARLSAGAAHTVLTRSDGTLWTTGTNTAGQLGDGSAAAGRSVLGQAGLPANAGNWVATAAGTDHTVALKADGSLWAWGGNQFGQLGDGTTVAKGTPVRVGTASDWTAVSAGGGSSFAVKADGTLWGWGQNNLGQLGNGDPAATPVDQHAPQQVQNLGGSPYVAVAAGGGHVLALQADGTLWSWGGSRYGQLGQGTADLAAHAVPGQVGIDNDWTALVAGGGHSLALKVDGTLWAWGENGAGQLGIGSADAAPHATPQQVATDRDWLTLAAGGFHSLAVKRNGTIWGWGSNQSGQLGNGTLVDQQLPSLIADLDGLADIVAVAAGAQHSLALSGTGEVYGWGANGAGQLGDGTAVGSLTPVLLANDVISWVSTEPGLDFTVARRSDGSLWSWGGNAGGQLGDGTITPRSTPVMIDAPRSWAAQSAGSAHTVAIRADGTLWSWGDNSASQLGDGTTISNLLPTPISVTQPSSATNDWRAVSAGDLHTLALKTDGTLWAWGDNTSGQLGDGTTAQRTVPKQVVIGQPGIPDNHWIAIAAGGTHSLALQADGTLWAWGDNGFGQLGDPAFGLSSSIPHQVVNVANPPTPGFNSSWAAITAGLSHSLALQADGTLWGWGDNFSGQLGNGDATLPNPADAAVPVQVQNPGLTPYVAVSTGDSSTVARQADGTLWSWGLNMNGQLGNGTADPTPLPHPVPVREAGAAHDWVGNGSGGSSAVALKGEGTLWSWGNNVSGQLGDGTTVDRSSPAPLLEARLLAPTAVDFGTVAIGTTAAQTITIGNGGTAPLSISSLAIGGTDAGFYSVAGGSCGAAPIAVAPAGSCTVQLAFAAAAPSGVTSATLSISSNAPTAPSLLLPLAGTSAAAFTITTAVTPAGSGTITPPGVVPALPGSSQAITIAPVVGYHLVDVTINGVSQGPLTSLTTPAATSNATVTAVMAVNSYAVTLTPGANGAITGPVTVLHGATPTYAITPQAGYHVTGVTVDGVSQGAVSALTLPTVTGNRTITATFAINLYTVSATSDSRGTITPAGNVPVPHGTGMTFTFTPNPGYHVVNVLVDGAPQGAMPSYTFINVVADNHTVRALFIPDGDMNNDGRVDVSDAVQALKMAVGLVSPAAADLLHGDVAPVDADGIPTPDNALSLADALLILKKAVGLTTGW